MEVEFLWLYASHESSIHKTPSSWSGIISSEAWKCLPRYHVWWPSAFQLYLAQQARDLHGIYSRAFSPRLNHKLQTVVWETFQETTRNASPVVKNKHAGLVLTQNYLTYITYLNEDVLFSLLYLKSWIILNSHGKNYNTHPLTTCSQTRSGS